MTVRQAGLVLAGPHRDAIAPSVARSRCPLLRGCDGAEALAGTGTRCGGQPFWAVTGTRTCSRSSATTRCSTTRPGRSWRPRMRTSGWKRADPEHPDHMDYPRHKVMRAIAVDWFRPEGAAGPGRAGSPVGQAVCRQADGAGRRMRLRQATSEVHYPASNVILFAARLPESDFAADPGIPRRFRRRGRRVAARQTPEEKLQSRWTCWRYFAAAHRRPQGSSRARISPPRSPKRARDGELLSRLDAGLVLTCHSDRRA